MTSTEPTRRPLSCKEVAQFLGISLPTLYSLLDRGEIHQIRAGRRRLIPAYALEAFLGEAYVPGTTAAVAAG